MKTTALNATNKTILVLALSSFCMGVTEFIIAGVLQDVKAYFGVDSNKAGLLTTLYAVGVVVGAPLLSIPLSGFNRKLQLLLNLGVFALANFVIYVSDNFILSAIARFIAGTQHGVFFVIATLTAIQVSPKEKESRNLALMVSGLTIALVSGVPLGTFIGQIFGFKSIFLLICLCTLIAFVSAIVFMPSHLQGCKTHINALFKAFLHLPLLKAYAITICTCGGAFVLYTYITDLLTQKSHFEETSIVYILLLYGIFAILGNLFGGRLADNKGSIRALHIVLFLQIVFYALVSVSAYSQVFVVINLAIMGFLSFASIPALKVNAMNMARKYTPDSMDSSVSVNEAAFNVGIALANQIGGLVVVAPFLGVGFNPLFASLFALPAFILVLRKIE
ncbi:MFS transporter [Helicobacter sp. MIT 21-1697]|uniref:MFS transporter n=1 Tax=Helicobacter sp. MIT 21-1697 TaxID=2993733 RepID=UPI00224A896D|nr:MFS transporter [Helicobacter sp. MIT 21-1697]MCX2716167.1 MFS transporter [Helicobacter sp. MIT 21-1697]